METFLLTFGTVAWIAVGGLIHGIQAEKYKFRTGSDRGWTSPAVLLGFLAGPFGILAWYK